MDNLNNKHRKLIHIGFEIGLLIKGIDGLLEIIGAVLLHIRSTVIPLHHQS